LGSTLIVTIDRFGQLASQILDTLLAGWLAPGPSQQVSGERERCRYELARRFGDLRPLFSQSLRFRFNAGQPAFVNRRGELRQFHPFQPLAQIVCSAGNGHLGSFAVKVERRVCQFLFGGECVQQTFFDRVRCDEVVDMDRVLLPHAVGPRNPLFQHGRVPGQITVNDDVGRLQIQTSAAGIGHQDHPAFRILLKRGDDCRAFLLRYAPVQPDVLAAKLIQTQLFVEKVAEIRGALSEEFGGLQVPLVIAGDFNSTPGSEVMIRLRNSWSVVLKGEDHLTFSSYEPDREIDFVLFRPHDRFEVLDQWLVNEPVASDHRPVIVDLLIRR